jgi:hypothetical protein
MTSKIWKPSQFFIKAVSPDNQPPEKEHYVIKTRLNNGGWASPASAVGIYEVRKFLEGQASEQMINEAIENLTVHRHAHVRAA